MPLTTKILDCHPDLCRNCYERRIRSVNPGTSKYDIDAMLQTIRREKPNEGQGKGSVPCLHGGEPLLLKIDDLEKFLALFHELHGSATIQTNGLLITDEHLKLFKKYNVSVGVSLDGDTAELNWERCNAGDLSRNQMQHMTDKVLENMRRCIDAGLKVSVISILRKCNASKDRIVDFGKFLLRLKKEFGINWVRTNEGIVYDDAYKDGELTQDELAKAFCFLADICLSDSSLLWFPYRDVMNAMFGYLGNITCVFTECDVWATQSEKTVLPDGSFGTCLKGGTALDGIQALRSEPSSLGHQGRERYIILQQLEQSENGCKDCKYWHICKGGCPGEGVDNDWRNRTRFCEAWKLLFQYIEDKIKAMFPNIVLMPDFFPEVPTPEIIFSSILSQGNGGLHGGDKTSLDELKKQIPKAAEVISSNRDHGDAPHGNSHSDSGHGDAPYSDRPHGDSDYQDRPHKDAGHGDAPHGNK